jgi:transposase
MGRAYSQDLRDRMIDAVIVEGMSRHGAAHRFGVSPAAAIKWVQLAYVEQMLVPILSSGDVIILDNLGSHKGAAARKAIRQAGAHLLLLPPYSPDLNPIEMVFAKLETLLRKAAERTVEATWKKIGLLLNHFTPNECENYRRHAGYHGGSN